MEITITKAPLGHVYFTTNSPQSHYGIPVVRVEMADGNEPQHDLGPGDAVPECLEPEECRETFGATANMAEWVYGCLLVDGTSEAVEAFYRWSAQLPGYNKTIPGYPR